MIDLADLIGQVWDGDFLELAAQLADGCVDCVVTSPPYPQGMKPVGKHYWRQEGRDGHAPPMQMRNREDLGRYRRKGTAQEQRQHIHGKPNQKGETGLEVRIAAPDWLDWFLSFTPEIKRILKPNGNFIVNVDSCCYPTRHRHWGVFSLPERMEAQGWCFVDAGIWEKPNGPPVSATTRFLHAWEFLYWFANGDRWEADIDAVRKPHAREWAEGDKSGWGFRRDYLAGTSDGRAGKMNPIGARPRDVFSCAVGGTRWDSADGAHFAAMPLKLAKWILSWASKPGDIVLDPFGGAATTGVAALELDRRPIICEITPAAAEIARKRMGRALEQLKLPMEVT